MAKKKKELEIENHSTILNEALEDIMGDRFGSYSKYIIQDRALPDVRDGLKPVQRRIIYAMYKDNNTWDRAYRKSAKTVGLVIGTYHPHGDTSVYDAMVRLSQNWKVRVPLIDMHGNNGSIDDDPAAAMRYTEARLAGVCEDVIGDIDYDTVAFSPNYDDSDIEPTVLPSKFPTLLVNGAMGIAAGYATNIAPNNLGEVMDACIYRLLNPTCSIDDLMVTLPGPDFPTGAIVMGREGIEQAFKTGRGKITVRSKCEIVDAKTIKQIVVNEIPYEVIKSQLVKRIDEIRINHDIDGLVDVRDESDRNGLKVVIDIKKEADANLILNYLYKNTPLQTNYSYNVVAIVNRTPKLLALDELLDAFINHRKEVVLKRTKYLLDKKEARCHIIEGLMHAISIMDELIETIRACKDKADVITTISAKFGFTQVQAEAIANLRLYRLSNTDVVALREEFAILVNEIESLKQILEEENVLVSTIVDEFKHTKEKYSTPRKTVICDDSGEVSIDQAAMVVSENVVVTVSKDGYIKRCSLKSYNASTSNIPGLKESDQVLCIGQCNTTDTLLLMTNSGNYIYLPVYKISEYKFKDIGDHVSKYVKGSDSDKILAAVVVDQFNTAAWIVQVTQNGLIKKTPVKDLQLSRYSKAIPLMKLKAKDEVVFADICYDNQEIIIASRNGYMTRFNLDNITMTTSKGQGVRCIKLSDKDRVTSCTIFNTDLSYLLVSNQHYDFKRIKLSDIKQTSTYVKGNSSFKLVKSNPSYLTTITSGDTNSTITYVNDNQFIDINYKDIAIMDCSSGFSKCDLLNSDSYLLNQLKQVQYVDINTSNCFKVHKKEDEENIHSDFEQTSLF